MKILILILIVLIVGKLVYNLIVICNFFMNDYELSDLMDNSFNNNDFLKNNVVIIFLGVFVCFFLYLLLYIFILSVFERDYMKVELKRLNGRLCINC